MLREDASLLIDHYIDLNTACFWQLWHLLFDFILGITTFLSRKRQNEKKHIVTAQDQSEFDNHNWLQVSLPVHIKTFNELENTYINYILVTKINSKVGLKYTSKLIVHLWV